MKTVTLLCLAATLSYGQVVEPWSWKNPLPQGNHLHSVFVRQDGEILVGGEGGTLLRSTTNGASWAHTPYPDGLHVLYAASFPLNTVGFITGDDRFGAGTIIKTTNGGLSWQRLQTNTFAALVDIQFLDAQVGFACGTRGTVIRTTDGGSTWDLLPTERLENVLSVDFRTPLIGTAALEGGRILDTDNGGASWVLRTISATRSVRSVRFNPEGKGLAVGDSGLVMTRSIEGGVWTVGQRVTTASMHAVHWINPRVAIAVGTDGGVIFSQDGGITWDSTRIDIGTDLTAVGGNDTSLVWAVGNFGSMALSSDAGRSWAVTSAGIRTNLQAVSTVPAGASIIVGSGPEVFRKNGPDAPWVRLQHDLPSSPQTLIMISDSISVTAGPGGAIFRTTDGGTQWSSVPSGVTGTLYAGSYRSGVAVLVGAGGNILRSTDDGASWSSQASTVTSGLRAVGFAGDRTVIAAGDGGNILRSTDAGVTWSAGTGPVVTRLQSVCFGDSSNGIVGGAPLGASLPPTVLSTSDGGDTWVSRQIAVPPSTDPFAFFTINTIASRKPGHFIAGTIEGTFFRSADAGQSWTQVLTGTYREVRSIAWGYDRWIAVGALGMILESPRDTTVVSVEPAAGRVFPGSPILLQAYPNPFNPSTTIAFSSPDNGHARVSVFDMLGRPVQVLFDGRIQAGDMLHAEFDASRLPSGTYVIRFETGRHAAARKLLLLR